MDDFSSTTSSTTANEDFAGCAVPVSLAPPGRTMTSVIPASMSMLDPPESTCLVTLVHRQDLDLKIESKGSMVDVLAGALNEARWDEINLVVSALRKALGTSKLIRQEALTDRVALVRMGSTWSPAARIYTTVVCSKDVLQRAWTVTERVLSLLVQNPQHRGSLHLDGLDPETENEVLEAVESALDTARGCGFSLPMIVEGAGASPVQIQGRLGRRRDRSNHQPYRVAIRGRVAGYRDTVKKLYLLVEQDDGAVVQIDFVKEQLRTPNSQTSAALIELPTLVEDGLAGRRWAFDTHRSVDGGGRPVYSFVRAVPVSSER